MNLRAVIVDDELANRGLLIMLLRTHCPHISVEGTAGTVRDAVKVIEKIKPDVVFLDVEMPGGDGFTLFNYFSKPEFLIVFVTAHQHYAIRAIQERAFDFILKPVSAESLEKVEKRLLDEIVFHKKNVNRQEEYFEKVDQLVRDIEQLKKRANRKIHVPTLGGFRLVDLTQVQFLEAEGNYTNIKFLDGNTMVVTRPIGDFENELEKHAFFRCHKSFLINLEQVESFNQNGGGSCTTVSGEVIPVSRRRQNEFIGKIYSLVEKPAS